MSVPVPDPGVAHFGREGMRRFGVARVFGVRLPESAREALEGAGVPLHVVPYFMASGTTDAPALGVFAGHHGLRRPPAELENWLRIGTDGLAHLCVRPDGVVQAVSLEADAEDMFVSSDIMAFNAAMTALDRTLPAIAASSGLSAAAADFRELSAELRGIDAGAFQERESWWPRVLDDVRHTLNFPFSAAFEYVDRAGQKHTVTETTGPGLLHPEELIWQRLAGEGVAAEQVRRVYCELEPCMMPGHYCAVWMQQMFPTAEFTHSFDYGTDADSRERGLKELITHAAEQAGRR
ncbi:nucleic acid/nucleotide deaminase domain-containing protein [Streptomyces sp. H27-D2]|uniref:nucleic acid/nucleotide deaminase domain-containing protein n=1 Tax=Streptomyces sp. H27-D2 TaxID=3046304 RepID=UPI002DBD82B4|nr:nucleic acid/nucleotide deaminase domain-containing protein [Streptomyces sp. H27-D2]MEC4018298.1 nucleic acid/nucleotide deaminase domain-containing protein [Streptomyces sp. H27-D2]